MNCNSVNIFSKRILLLVFINSIVLFNSATAQFIFQRTYGFSSISEGADICAGFDGGYLICGTTAVNTSDIYLVKINEDGSLQWHRSFGSYNIERATAIIPTNDNCYLVVGYSNSFSPSGDYDFYMLKINVQGQLVWEKTLGGPDWDFARCITADPTGGFVIGGVTYNGLSGTPDGIVVKIDTAGNLIWQHIFNTPVDDEFNGISTTDNNEFMAAGTLMSGINGSKDIIAARVSATGDSVYYKQYGSVNEEEAFAISSRHGSYVIVGSDKNNIDTLGLNNLTLVVNDNGDSISTSILVHDKDEITTALDSTDINYWITGYTVSYGGGKKDLFISKTDSIGTDLGGTTFGGSEDEIGYAIMSTPDGGAIAVGSSTTFAPGTKSVFVVKIDSLKNTGSLVIGIDEENAGEELFIFYKQISKTISVTHPAGEGSFNYILTDMAGRNCSFEIESESGKDLIFPTALSSGVYILNISNNERKFTYKFVVN